MTWKTVQDEIKRKSYGILSTCGKDGAPHSVGVMYATMAADPFSLYVVTERKSRKARNIASNKNVIFAIPVPRRLWFIPPSSIQFQVIASIVPFTENVTKAFSASLALREILKSTERHFEEPDGSCVVEIIPGRFVFTYGLGISVLALARNFGDASARVSLVALDASLGRK
ncbi:MAG: pyridoxamine 5'-phosphate oxidase family protein [Nitrososphaerales archaeon]